VTSGRRDWSSPSPLALCDHPQHHPGHFITIPGTLGTCGDRTPPRQLLCLVRPHVSGTLEPSQRVATEQATPTLPPSKPLLDEHMTRCDAPPDARFARTAVYSTMLYTMALHVDEIVRHACKLLPPWPIKGGGRPPAAGGGRTAHTCTLSAFTKILALASINTSGTWRPDLLSRLACSPLYEHYSAT
jgi:hypothetical protein